MTHFETPLEDPLLHPCCAHPVSAQYRVSLEGDIRGLQGATRSVTVLQKRRCSEGVRNWSQKGSFPGPLILSFLFYARARVYIYYFKTSGIGRPQNRGGAVGPVDLILGDPRYRPQTPDQRVYIRYYILYTLYTGTTEVLH